MDVSQNISDSPMELIKILLNIDLPLELFCKFNKLAALTTDTNLMVKAINGSDLLMVKTLYHMQALTEEYFFS